MDKTSLQEAKQIKYLKYENKIYRVIDFYQDNLSQVVGFDLSPRLEKITVGLACLEDSNNLYIVNLTDVEELSVEEHEIISVLDR